MKIENISLIDNTLNITLDQSNDSVSIVYIDSLDNDSNKYSTNSDDHTWSITEFTKQDNVVSINVEALQPELDTSAFTILIDNTLGFYFDKDELYNKEICLLTEFCSTCLDKHQKEREVLFVIKYELLKYAIENNIIEDQISIYKDIARMLNIDVKLNAQNICNCRCTGRKCCNGCCALC